MRLFWFFSAYKVRILNNYKQMTILSIFSSLQYSAKNLWTSSSRQHGRYIFTDIGTPSSSSDMVSSGWSHRHVLDQNLDQNPPRPRSSEHQVEWHLENSTCKCRGCNHTSLSLRFWRITVVVGVRFFSIVGSRLFLMLVCRVYLPPPRRFWYIKWTRRRLWPNS